MGKKPEEEVEARLRELEASMKEGSNMPTIVPGKTTELPALSSQSPSTRLSKSTEATVMKGDLHLLGGFVALALGIFFLFSHVQVSMGWNRIIFGGSDGGGILILLLVIGIGVFLYDYKNKFGWLLIGASVAGIIIVLFAGMHPYLAPMSFLEIMTAMLPLALGGALIARGVKINSCNQDQNSAK